MVIHSMTVKNDSESNDSKPQYIAQCFDCKHRYFTKWTPDTIPTGYQCPKCFSFAIILEEEYKEHIDSLHKEFSKEEVESIIKFIDFAQNNDYLINFVSKRTKFQHLLEDLLKSY